MKVANSLKTLKTRHKDCKVAKREGVLIVLNKAYPKFKAKQGSKKHPKFMPKSKQGF